MRTGSRKLKLLFLFTSLGVACTPLNSLWVKGSANTSKDTTSLAQSGDEIEGLPVSAVSQDREVLLSDTSTGLSILKEAELDKDKFRIKTGTAEPVMKVLKLTSPARLVVDLIGAKASQTREISVANSDSVSSIRVGSHADKVRVVFDLKSQAALNGHSIESVGKEVALSVPVKEETRLSRVSSFSNSFSASAKLNEQEELDPVNSETEEQVAKDIVKDEITLGKEIGAEDGTQTENLDAASQPELDVASSKPDQGSEIIDDGEVVGQQPKEVATNSNKTNKPLLTKVDFDKTFGSAGEVKASLTDEVAFELKQTSQSEYVMAIPGITADEAAKKPFVSAKGEEGIRSVRVTENKDGVLVRMFVDPGVILTALPRGNDILIKAGKPSMNPSARAQLESPDTKGMTEGDKAAQSNPTGLRSSDGSKIYTGRLISLDLQDTDIDSALRIIAEISNLNIIASDDVNGKVTLRLIDVPWDQALDVILKTNGLDQVAEGNVIRIAPVDKLRAERESLKEAKRAAENLEDLTVQYVRVSYARAEDIRPKIEAVLSERGTVTADERTNQLIIKDIQMGQKQALDLLKKLDLRTPQVLLETQIVEGNRNILRDLGFQWNFNYIQSPQTGNATGLNFPNSASVIGGAADGSANPWAVNFPAAITGTGGSAVTAILDSADGSKLIGVRLSALESEGKVRVVSRPQVATINNKAAQISSIEVVRIRVPSAGTSVATGSGAQASAGGAQAFQSFNVGIEMEVTPQASPDYFVLLDVNAKSSTFGSRDVDGIPSTVERSTNSTILVKSGQTFALGGVYRLEERNGVTGVPFMKDIPVLGHLFRRTTVDNKDEELIFFITPHIVEGSFDAEAM